MTKNRASSYALAVAGFGLALAFVMGNRLDTARNDENPKLQAVERGEREREESPRFSLGETSLAATGPMAELSSWIEREDTQCAVTQPASSRFFEFAPEHLDLANLSRIVFRVATLEPAQYVEFITQNPQGGEGIVRLTRGRIAALFSPDKNNRIMLSDVDLEAGEESKEFHLALHAANVTVDSGDKNLLSVPSLMFPGSLALRTNADPHVIEHLKVALISSGQEIIDETWW